MNYLWSNFVLILCFMTLVDNRKIQSTAKRKHNKQSSIEYYTGHETRLDVSIHIDKPLYVKLVKEHNATTRRSVQTIFNDMLKHVEELYQHPSFNHSIRFRLLDTRILRNKTDMVVINEDGSKYLKSYCEWQAKKKMTKRKLYYSVLLTGLDLYYINSAGKRIKSSTGRSYLGGVCNINKSCSLLEWNSKNIVYLVAHEIAHSFGVLHDGLPYNECRNEGHIMTAKYNPRSHPRTWTQCSKHEFEQFLLSRKAWCLTKSHDNNSADF